MKMYRCKLNFELDIEAKNEDEAREIFANEVSCLTYEDEITIEERGKSK